jgi:4-hydroxy-2-oxoglutarate aldolase
MKLKLEGIFSPLTTPFNSNEDLDLANLEKNIERYNEFNLAGYVALGSTGENVYLSNEESEKVVEIFEKCTPDNKIIIAGIAQESLKETVRLIKRLANYRINAFLIKTPHYYKLNMNFESLKNYYLKIAELSPKPIIIYNVPQFTGLQVSSELITELSNHPNITGLKDSSENLNFLSDIIHQVSEDFNILVGAGSVFYSGLLLGAKGGILAVSNVAPQLCINIFKFVKLGRIEEARKLQLKLLPLNNTLVNKYGIPSIKYALDLLGFYGGPPRTPLLPISDKAKEEIKKVMRNSGILK